MVTCITIYRVVHKIEVASLQLENVYIQALRQLVVWNLFIYPNLLVVHSAPAVCVFVVF